ncbi:hypothetical protein [Neosynechococcus sphagnicola]|uniref:hypothetical protein n=1 Tax=Neosynechococcus sphagnicola TaxID=1501145 RepID=UPI000A962BEF|nr:hypothetical protein [Neosynechococcus sphagnicola]
MTTSVPIQNSGLRIISLIPSATEILAVLGLTAHVVGRSHACDYPPEIQSLPICTQPKFDPGGSSRVIHQRVTELLQSALSVYQVNLEILQQLQPTHILTQAQCEVCAVSLCEVEEAVGMLIGRQPQIISLQPNTLADVWADIHRVGDSLGREATPVIHGLLSRIQVCEDQTTAELKRPTVACIEWTDPLMAAGNWIPELVTLAGGSEFIWPQWRTLPLA